MNFRRKIKPLQFLFFVLLGSIPFKYLRAEVTFKDGITFDKDGLELYSWDFESAQKLGHGHYETTLNDRRNLKRQALNIARHLEDLQTSKTFYKVNYVSFRLLFSKIENPDAKVPFALSNTMLPETLIFRIPENQLNTEASADDIKDPATFTRLKLKWRYEAGNKPYMIIQDEDQKIRAYSDRLNASDHIKQLYFVDLQNSLSPESSRLVFAFPGFYEGIGRFELYNLFFKAELSWRQQAVKLNNLRNFLIMKFPEVLDEIAYRNEHVIAPDQQAKTIFYPNNVTLQTLLPSSQVAIQVVANGGMSPSGPSDYYSPYNKIFHKRGYEVQNIGDSLEKCVQKQRDTLLLSNPELADDVYKLFSYKQNGELRFRFVFQSIDYHSLTRLGVQNENGQLTQNVRLGSNFEIKNVALGLGADAYFKTLQDLDKEIVLNQAHANGVYPEDSGELQGMYAWFIHMDDDGDRSIALALNQFDNEWLKLASQSRLPAEAVSIYTASDENFDTSAPKLKLKVALGMDGACLTSSAEEISTAITNFKRLNHWSR